MKKLIDTACARYHNAPPPEKARYKAAFKSLGLLALFPAYTALKGEWQTSLGIILAVAIIITLALIPYFFLRRNTKKSKKEKSPADKARMENIAATIGAFLILGFFVAVFCFIAANWGR